MEVGRWVGGWLAGEAVGSALNDMGQTGSIGWRKETGGYFVSTTPRVCWRWMRVSCYWLDRWRGSARDK